MKNKEHLLFICHRIPYPPNKGDKIRSFNFLRYLATLYTIHLVFLVDEEKDLKYVSGLKRYADTIFYETISPISKKVTSFVSSLLLKKPVSVPYFYSSRLQQKIDTFLDNNTVDKILCFSSPTAEYVFQSSHLNNTSIQPPALIMDLVDVDSHKWRQYADGGGLFFQWLYKREADLLLSYEKTIVASFQHTILVSEPEKDILNTYIQGDSLHVVSNGVDTDYFSPEQGVILNNRKPTLVFVGAMDYLPNIEGIKWFVGEILPAVKSMVPEVQLQIVGSKPAKEVVDLQAVDGVTVTGFVEDVRDYLRSADICVVPLQIARGIQNKVLEAMAMGKPVLCTEDALTGIDAIPDENILVANDAAGFAETVILLLNNVDLRNEIGRRARECMVAKYSWQTRLEQLRMIMADGE